MNLSDLQDKKQIKIDSLIDIRTDILKDKQRDRERLYRGESMIKMFGKICIGSKIWHAITVEIFNTIEENVTINMSTRDQYKNLCGKSDSGI